MAGLVILAVVAGALAIACAWADSKPTEPEPTDDRCPVVLLSAHRAARQPGSNVALIRGGKR